MRKILYCILPIFLCSVLSCDRKRQPSEQDMKDSLAAANFMKCAKFLTNFGKLLLVPYIKDFGRITQF